MNSPFKKFVVTIGNLPTAYMESMSYYEAITYLTNYIANNLAPAEQANAEAILELQNYFENLDVQEEINNKLDEMADDGTLAEILNVEMIGDLQNLSTSDKSSVVNAINEVNNSVSQFNLTDFTQYNPTNNNMTVNNGNYVGGNITIAKNTDGTIAKIYGSVLLSDVQPQAETTLTLLNTGLEADEQFTIYPTGSTLQYTSTFNNFVVDNSATILTNGSVTIKSQKVELNEDVTERITLYPCIYFIKNFGD